MPPRAPPKIHQLHMRAHKLSIMVTVPPSTTIMDLKQEALSALTSTVNQVEDIPEVENVNDFELCRAVKAKGRPNGEYEVLDVLKAVENYNLASYDTLYLQFRDASGDLLPVTFSIPPIDDDEIEPEEDISVSSSSKGKRKAQVGE